MLASHATPRAGQQGIQTMSTIISARFDTLQHAEAVVRELNRAGLAAEEINLFFSPAPGQHGAYPIGGDEHADPQARGAEHRTLVGAAIGAGVGVLAGAVAGPLGAVAGAAVGGYTGSLAGTMSGLGEHEDAEARRPAGIVVAVDARRDGVEHQALSILRQAGADPVETTDGEWHLGEWADFDPVAPPTPATSGEGAAPGRATEGATATETGRPEVVYRVSPGGGERWNVFEGDLGKLLSEFPSREEALEYAASLARMKTLAVVEVYRAGGMLESSRVFSSRDPYASRSSLAP